MWQHATWKSPHTEWLRFSYKSAVVRALEWTDMGRECERTEWVDVSGGMERERESRCTFLCM